MQLDEFITETLVGIQKGVRGAIDKVSEANPGGAIAPVFDDFGGYGYDV